MIASHESWIRSLNGTNENCEHILLGWKKLQEYDPSQKYWKYISDLEEMQFQKKLFL